MRKENKFVLATVIILLFSSLSFNFLDTVTGKLINQRPEIIAYIAAVSVSEIPEVSTIEELKRALGVTSNQFRNRRCNFGNTAQNIKKCNLDVEITTRGQFRIGNEFTVGSTIINFNRNSEWLIKKISFKGPRAGPRELRNSLNLEKECTDSRGCQLNIGAIDKRGEYRLEVEVEKRGCQEDDFRCAEWSACVPNQMGGSEGTQRRRCTKLNNCAGEKPKERQSCTICFPNWRCDEWEPLVCPASEEQTRTCRDENSCGTNLRKPNEIRSCACTPNWRCLEWNSISCVPNQGSNEGTKTRICTDQNSCGKNEGKPPETSSCKIGPIKIYEALPQMLISGTTSTINVRTGTDYNWQQNNGRYTYTLTGSTSSRSCSVFLNQESSCEITLPTQTVIVEAQSYNPLIKELKVKESLSSYVAQTTRCSGLYCYIFPSRLRNYILEVHTNAGLADLVIEKIMLNSREASAEIFDGGLVDFKIDIKNIGYTNVAGTGLRYSVRKANNFIIPRTEVNNINLNVGESKTITTNEFTYQSGEHCLEFEINFYNGVSEAVLTNNRVNLCLNL